MINTFNLLHSRHVQVNNESAIEFYQKFGFKIVETKDQYYKRIEPAGAHVLEKNLREENASNNNNSQSTVSTNGTNLPNGVDHPKSKAS